MEPCEPSKPYSQYGLSAQSDGTGLLNTSRLFHVYNTFSHSLNIATEDKKHLYYVNISMFTPGKPDVTLHAGSDRSAPIAAVCKFIRLSANMNVGLGDPKDPNNVIWEALTKENWDHSKYRWEMTIHSQKTMYAGGGLGERKAFLWKRTHHVGIGNSMPSMLSERNFKLEDAQTGELIAVYADNGIKSFKKCGKFQINVDYGSDFDSMVLITGLALLEKERRRKNQ
jgi:hypothetical protein